MADFNFFAFEEGPGSTITEERWTEMFSWMRTTGVLPVNNPLSSSADLAVNVVPSPVGTQVQVEDGEGFIQGFYFEQTNGPEVLDITLNSSGNDRIDLVTLRLDKPNDIVSYHIIEGTPAGSPVAPSPVQNSTIWDLPLAEVLVEDGATEIVAMDITDERVKSVQGSGGSSAVTLSSGTGDESLVKDGTGPDLENKALTGGTSISLTSTSEAVTITNDSPATSVTLGSGTGDESLVKDGTGESLETKALSEGTGISMTSDSEAVTINTTTSLSNGTADEELVTGSNPSFTVKGISSGTGIALSSTADAVTVTNDDPASDIDIANGTGDEQLVTGSNPDYDVKAISAGTGIGLSSDANAVTITNDVALSNGTADETLVTGSNPNFTLKGIDAGTNISLSSDANAVTVTGANAPSDQPICILRRDSNLTVGNGSTTKITWSDAIYDPYNMWDSGATSQEIIVPEDGFYFVNVNLTWQGDASADGTVRAFIDRPSVRIAESRVMMVGDNDVSNNFSVIYTMSMGGDFDVSVNNLSGVSLDVLSTGVYTPTVAVYKIRSL